MQYGGMMKLLHEQQKKVSAMLSKELVKEYKIKSLAVRKGDTVKIMRGQFKGKSGKIEKVDLKRERVFVEKAELVKANGSKAKYPIHPSNLMITSVEMSDKKRIGGAKQ